MKREFKGIQRKGLPGGPHEQFTYVTGVFMQDMYHVPKAQKGLEKYQGDEKSETKESRKDFIKRYNETPFKYLNAMAGDFVKFDRDLTKEEIEELGIITDDPKYFDIISSSLGQVRNLGKNRRYGISDMDEYAEIPKNSELWKEIYKQDTKNQRESYLEHKLKDRQWTGKRDFKLTQNVIDELNYLKSLKEGDKDFFRKYDTDVIEDSILKAYGIYDQDVKSLRKRAKYNKSANDFAKELSLRYIYGDEPIPTLNEGQEIIVSKDGQYAHPGKITRIPGNNITMKGVPYPVYAIPNIGIPTMMQSGQDYYFPDADYVDEIPMMQDGNGEKYLNKYALGFLTARPLREALRRRLYESVTPIAYDPLHAAKEFAAGKRLPFKWNNYTTSYEEIDEHPMFMDPVRGRNPLGEKIKTTSDDAWNYLLNREQKFNTLRPSKNKPSINTGEDIETMSFVDDRDIFEEAKMLGIFDKNIGDTLKVSDSSAGGFTLDNYTLSKGRDSRGNYISYYDRYDINPKLFGMGIPVSHMVGKGEYDLYGRMYYNPVTRERIYPETQITNLPETIRKRVQNVGIEEEDGTIYTPFALPTATVTADVKQEGGAIAKKQLNSDLLKTYKNYINGVDESAEAVRAYDKLNRIFYKESKLNNMSAPNYIMTHIIPNA